MYGFTPEIAMRGNSSPEQSLDTPERVCPHDLPHLTREAPFPQPGNQLPGPGRRAGAQGPPPVQGS